MELGKTLYLTDRKKWRSWLAKNHDKEREIWLIYYRKSSGKPRLSYEDAVEEALCYGWIDSIQKGIDDEKFAQRFTPRKMNSSFSEANRERVRRLIQEGKMTRAGLKAISGSFDVATDQGQAWRVAPDILEGIKSDKLAWKNFQTLPEDYRRVRIGFIESRRRHGDEMFQRSLRHFVKITARNKKFGIMK